MDKTCKPYFEILNNFWTLIKPYTSKEDEEAYKKIMTDNFKMFTKDRGEKYTDEWWVSIKDVTDYPDKYKGTRYVEFAAELAIAICDYWQQDSFKKADYYDFLTHVGKAFLNEWERIRK